METFPAFRSVWIPSLPRAKVLAVSGSRADAPPTAPDVRTGSTSVPGEKRCGQGFRKARKHCVPVPVPQLRMEKCDKAGLLHSTGGRTLHIPRPRTALRNCHCLKEANTPTFYSEFQESASGICHPSCSSENHPPGKLHLHSVRQNSVPGRCGESLVSRRKDRTR